MKCHMGVQITTAPFVTAARDYSDGDSAGRASLATLTLVEAELAMANFSSGAFWNTQGQ